MSKPLDVMFHQRMLACAGLYQGKLDGGWGKKTDAADKAFHTEYLRLQSIGGTFDPRTEAAIMTLLPKAQEKARQFMQVAGSTCKLLSGTRTYAEQDALFGQRPVVTRARGGSSNHNFCIAWDVGIFIDGRYLTGAKAGDDAKYDELAHKVKAHVTGLEWGGDWKSIVDKPHYQLVTGKTTAQVRAAFEAGEPFI